MNDVTHKSALIDAKYSVKSWLQQKKARAEKKINPKAPVHSYTVDDLTRSFRETLQSFKGTNLSLETLKDAIVLEYPNDLALISEMFNSLEKRLPARNLVGYNSNILEI